MGYPLQYSWASLVPQMVKNSPAMRETGHFFSRGSGFFRFSSMILLPKRVNFFFLWQLQQLYAQYCICDGFMCRAAKKSCPHSLLAHAPSFKSPAKDSPSASISGTLRQLCFESQQLLFVERSFFRSLFLILLQIQNPGIHIMRKPTRALFSTYFFSSFSIKN